MPASAQKIGLPAAASISIEVESPPGSGRFSPADFSLLGSVEPRLRISGVPAGARVFNDRPDGRAGLGGGLGGNGRDITAMLAPASAEPASAGKLAGQVPLLAGENIFLVTDRSGLRVLARATLLAYSPRFEDLNGNGLLDKDEDANGNGQLDPGEDLNSNELLDRDEDMNRNGRLDVDEDPTSGVVPVGSAGGPYVLTFSTSRDQLLGPEGRMRSLSLRRPGESAADPPFANLRFDSMEAARLGQVPGVVFDDFVFEITLADFGDAAAGYPVRLAENGARHLNTALEWFGKAGRS